MHRKRFWAPLLHFINSCVTSFDRAVITLILKYAVVRAALQRRLRDLLFYQNYLRLTKENFAVMLQLE